MSVTAEFGSMTFSSSESQPAINAEPATESDRNSAVTPRRLARILEDGLQFGKYRVVRLIAIGGMSEIYEAEHMGLDKRVALKVMRRDLAENPIARQRFISEGVNAARLRHTNVVDVTDVGEVDELPFLVMALLDGEDLGRVYDRQGRIPIPEIVDLLLPVASAVAVGHEKGVVHRDLKPDNIFLHREGCRLIPKVLDFGVSRVMTARRITLNSSVFGTPHYMSPEQARGGPTDARTDQYSLGVILYEGVTGRLPRDSANPIELLHAVAYDSFRPPSDYYEIPPALEAVILRAMAAEPGDRFPSMRDLAVALLPFASESAREYWSLELAASTEPDTGKRLPQISRHPSPTPRSLSQALDTTQTNMRAPGPVRRNDIVVARTVPPPPPPPRPRDATPAQIVAQTRARLELEVLALETQRKRRTRSMLVGAGAGVLLGISVFGVWFMRGEPEQPTAGTRPKDAAYFDVDVQASPGNATIVVDGTTVATGQFIRRYRIDGVEHELRVSAQGWLPATVKFRDASPPKVVRLEPAPAEPQVSVFAAPAPSQSQPNAQPSTKLARIATRRAPATSSTHAAPAERERSAATSRARDENAQSTVQPIDGDDSDSTPHVAVVEPTRPRIRIVDEFEPKIRVVE
jgi:serine/threonine protein kinase